IYASQHGRAHDNHPDLPRRACDRADSAPGVSGSIWILTQAVSQNPPPERDPSGSPASTAARHGDTTRNPPGILSFLQLRRGVSTAIRRVTVTDLAGRSRLISTHSFRQQLANFAVTRLAWISAAAALNVTVIVHSLALFFRWVKLPDASTACGR